MNSTKQLKINCFYILLTISLSFSCSERFKKDLLPKDYRLLKKESFVGSVDMIYVYDIKVDSINLSSLHNYPKSCKGANCTSGCEITGWMFYRDIDPEESIRLLKIVSEQNVNKQHIEINDLIEDMKLNDNILFSACYVPPIGGKKHKYYEIMSFLDIEEMKLYVFDYLEDPF